MKIIGLLLLCFAINGVIYGQITFKLESVTPTDTVFAESSVEDIYQKIYEPNLRPSRFRDASKPLKVPLKIIAKSNDNNQLIDFRGHPFLEGLFEAYRTHRPIVISPDMIWLLISQGFSQHVNNNAEQLRHYFVNFEGRKELVVQMDGEKDKLFLDNPDAPWQLIFPRFTSQISAHVGKELIQTLTSDFTTSTPTSTVASQITIMDAMKKYFEYKVIMMGCGLPEITLEGTTKDWEKVLQKTQTLSKYDLRWWTDRLEPILKEFIETSKGRINKDFWINFIKKHEEKGAYGISTGIDGHIVQFYPYNKDGRKLSGTFLWNGSSLPNEVVQVPMKYELRDDAGGVVETKNLMLWSGLIGCSQNSKTKAIKPEIGWMISYAPFDSTKFDGYKNAIENDGSLTIQVSSGQGLPEELFSVQKIRKLRIKVLTDFGGKGTIRFPAEFYSIKTDTLHLDAAISPEESLKIFNAFPTTVVLINNKSRKDLEIYLAKKKEPANNPVKKEDGMVIIGYGYGGGVEIW